MPEEVTGTTTATQLFQVTAAGGLPSARHTDRKPFFIYLTFVPLPGQYRLLFGGLSQNH